MIGLGYYGTFTPPVDPAQRPGEPGLVHRVHALPAGDLAGPARGAAQLPDRGRRPHRAADLRRLAAGRGHRRRRGDGAVPPGRQGQGRRLPGRRRLLPADHRRDPDPRRADRRRGRGRRPVRRHPGGGRRARRLRRAAAVPGRLRRGARPAPGHRAGARAGRGRHRRRRPAGADPAHLARASSAPTSRSAPRSASACRWASAARTPATWRCASEFARSLPGRLVGVSVDADGNRRTGWRCRPASSTSAGRRPPATSAPRRCCSP